MHRVAKRFALLAGIAAAVLIPASAMGSGPAVQQFTVAFNNPSGLPANVDAIVAEAPEKNAAPAGMPDMGGMM